MYRVALRFLAKLALSAAVTIPFVSPSQAVEVYLFRGAGDFSFVNHHLQFSKGLDEIAATMNGEGIHAEVRRFEAIGDALTTIRKRKPSSVAFIGHSMGALASMNMARKMREAGIRVAYIGLIDIPGPVGVAGNNVEWAENFYSIHPVYGRFTNTKSHPRAENIHVSGFIHNRMDNSPFVQKRLLDAVRQVHNEEQRKLQEQQRLQRQPQLVETYQQPVYTPAPAPVYAPQPLPEPVYTPPQPDVFTQAGPVPQAPVPNGLDSTTTTSIQPSYQPAQEGDILSKAARFLNRIKTRSNIQTRAKTYQNNR